MNHVYRYTIQRRVMALLQIAETICHTLALPLNQLSPTSPTSIVVSHNYCNFLTYLMHTQQKNIIVHMTLDCTRIVWRV